jgi:hypothetical protein
MSFDACIVNITWHLLSVVTALWVVCPTRYITLAPRSSSDLLMVVCFHIFHRLSRKHLVLLTDVVSGIKSFSDAPHLAWKCGTHRSDSHVRAL